MAGWTSGSWTRTRSNAWLSAASIRGLERKLVVICTCPVGEGAGADLVVDGDVGAAKAVDRLLRVADHGEPPGRRRELAPVLVGRDRLIAGEQQGELGLDRVGVLELVDQHDLVAAAEVVARGLVVAQQVARPEQQVVEVRLARLEPLQRVLVDEPLDLGEQAEQRVGAQAVLGGLVRVAVCLLERLQLLLALRAPVAFRAAR